MAIVVVAFVLRLVVCADLKRNETGVTHPSSQTDNYTYQKIAFQVLDGEFDYSKGFYYQPFYSGVFLPACYAISGRSIWGVIVVQSLLGAGAVLLVGLAFAELFGRKAGLIGAGLLALTRFHIFYTPFTLIAVLQSFLLMLLVWLTIRAAKKKQWWLWALAGLAFGLANATRGNIILLLPFGAALLLWCGRHKLGKAGIHLVLFLLCFYLPLLPFAIVNYRAHGRWVGASSAGPNVLALGNTPESPAGGRIPGDSGPMAYPESYSVWVGQNDAKGAEHVSIYKNIWLWFKREPLAYVELKARMFLLFWNRVEIPNNTSILRGGNPIPAPTITMPLVPFDFWLIGGLGLTGLLFALARRRKSPRTLFCLAATVGYSLSIVLFYILARFRVPVLPLLCGFGGFGAMTLWNSFKQRAARPRKLVVRLAICVFAFGFVAVGYDVYHLGWEVHATRLARPNGTRLHYPAKDVLKDHGDDESYFGMREWKKIDDVKIEKTLVPMSPAAEFSRLELRLLIIAEMPSEIEINGLGDTVRRQFKRGRHWLRLELPPEPRVYYLEDGQLRLSFRVKAVAGGPCYIVLDQLRDYGRTLINGKAPGAELVLELHMHRTK